jgi:transcriptional regulator with XRE-family HTH domain
MCKPNPKFVVGRVIRFRRKALKLTQAQIARLVGCTPEMICLIEREERRPGLDMVPALAAALRLEALSLGIAVMQETAPRFAAILVHELGKAQAISTRPGRHGAGSSQPLGNVA